MHIDLRITSWRKRNVTLAWGPRSPHFTGMRVVHSGPGLHARSMFDNLRSGVLTSLSSNLRAEGKESGNITSTETTDTHCRRVDRACFYNRQGTGPDDPHGAFDGDVAVLHLPVRHLQDIRHKARTSQALNIFGPHLDETPKVV